MNQCVTSSKTKLTGLTGLDAGEVDRLTIQDLLLITQLETRQVNHVFDVSHKLRLGPIPTG